MQIHYKKLTEKELDTFIKMRIRQLREEGAKELLARVVDEAAIHGFWLCEERKLYAI